MYDIGGGTPVDAFDAFVLLGWGAGQRLVCAQHIETVWWCCQGLPLIFQPLKMRPP